MVELLRRFLARVIQCSPFCVAALVSPDPSFSLLSSILVSVLFYVFYRYFPYSSCWCFLPINAFCLPIGQAPLDQPSQLPWHASSSPTHSRGKRQGENSKCQGFGILKSSKFLTEKLWFLFPFFPSSFWSMDIIDTRMKQLWWDCLAATNDFVKKKKRISFV